MHLEFESPAGEAVVPAVTQHYGHQKYQKLENHKCQITSIFDVLV